MIENKKQQDKLQAADIVTFIKYLRLRGNGHTERMNNKK
jgi:hypothetical protein